MKMTKSYFQCTARCAVCGCLCHTSSFFVKYWGECIVQTIWIWFSATQTTFMPCNMFCVHVESHQNDHIFSNHPIQKKSFGRMREDHQPMIK